jgi:hypothetical protein
MTTREHAAGNENLILPVDTGWCFSGEFLIIQDKAEFIKPL